MDSSSSANTSKRSFDYSANPLAKLKRLKIQERQQLNNLNKSYSQECDENFKHCTCKSSKFKKNLIEINNLLQEIKENSCSQEDIKESDINDIKKDVLNMENKMLLLKKAIETELNSIKSSELILTQKINEECLMLAKKRSTTVIKPYNDIVPSPVKALMNSPAKAKEIQDFQDFIVSNGRYGGWLEYNHNIFVKVWQKYFNTETQHTDIDFLTSASFCKFSQEVFEKITGLTYDEIQDHSKWYLKFMSLKYSQQKAINSWKQKRLIKKGYYGYENTISGPEKRNHKEHESPSKHTCCLKNDSPHKTQGDNISVASLDCSLRTKIHGGNKKSQKGANIFDENALTRVTRPTEQWNNRCFGILDTSDDGKTNMDVESLGKLCVPQWRSYILN